MKIPWKFSASLLVCTFLALLYPATGLTYPSPRALLIGNPALSGEFREYLRHYGARVDQASSWNNVDLTRLSRYQALVVCQPMTGAPLELSRSQSQAVLEFVHRGGRAYVEYTRFADGTLPGWRVEKEPVLERFERIAASRDYPAGSRLRKDDLLEEHNSYLLNTHPPTGAETLLEYGLYMGTYSVARTITDGPTYFVVTVDLGREIALDRAQQSYGGLSKANLPDLVRLSLAGEDGVFRPAGEIRRAQFQQWAAIFSLGARTARFVRFYIERDRRGNQTEHVVLNGIEIHDGQGKNVALHRPYEFQQKEDPVERVPNGPLTSGEPPRSWREDRTYFFPVQRRMGLNAKRWEALVSWRHGRGQLFYAATSLSVFRQNDYRLTSRWEDLIRGLSLSLLPDAVRPSAARRWIPLRAHTQPRRWTVPGETVELHVESVAGARILPAAPGLGLGAVREVSPGHFVFSFRPAAGEYCIGVTAKSGPGWNTARVRLSVQDRASMYRRALDRNMRWFLNAGVLPDKDGSQGVKSTIDLSALRTAGPAEDLPSPFRMDCQAMTGKAFWLYGDVSGDETWHRRAHNLARYLMRHQYSDPEKASFGAFRWLAQGSRSIYPQDDNNRIAEYLAWLYERTGETDYLTAALRCVEFMRDTGREDFTLSYWSADDNVVDARGRAYLRTVNTFPNYTDWCLWRYHYAWRATGDAVYRNALRTLARVYGELTLEPGGQVYQRLGERGCAIALNYLDTNDQLKKRLATYCDGLTEQHLRRDDVRTYGVEVPANDISRETVSHAYNNDCDIHTFRGETLSDQLYVLPHRALVRWEDYKAKPSPLTRRAVETVLDYLVRIQFESSDSRLDGCWLRSFDFSNWEFFGTRYDPNYGAYHAYTGWMNSIISQSLASYLLDENPFATLPARQSGAPDVLRRVREEPQSISSREVNYLRGIRLSSDQAPDVGSRTLVTLTDGVIEGPHSDGLSAGWSLNPPRSVTLEGDLGRTAVCRRISLRLGGLDPAAMAGDVVFEAATTPGQWQEVLRSKLIAADGINWLEFPERPIRYLRLRLNPAPGSETVLYVGEIQLIGQR